MWRQIVSKGKGGLLAPHRSTLFATSISKRRYSLRHRQDAAAIVSLYCDGIPIQRRSLHSCYCRIIVPKLNTTVINKTNYQRKDREPHLKNQSRHLVTQSSRPLTCWSCTAGRKEFSFFCTTCGKIQPVEKGITFFDVLGIEKTFVISLREMELAYWSRQKLLHPDHFTNFSEKERELSAEASTILNVAYSTLKRPHIRAKYMLELEGIDALSEDGSTDVDQDLVMEIMDIREELEDIISQGTDELTKQLESMQSQNLKRIEECVTLMETAFSENNLGKATNLAVRLQYYTKISDEISEQL